MIRLILVVLFLALYAIFSIPMYLVQYLIGRKNPDKQFRIAQSIVRGAFKIILFLSGTKLTVKGRENVPKDTGVVYISNHRSDFDVLLAYSTVPTLTSFVSKKEVNKVPCIRTWMRYMKCLFLDRDDIREGLKTILTGIEQLKEGYSVFIMPEGTRNFSDEMLPFHEGSFKLASKSGCPIVPVAIKNADAVFEKQKPFIRSAKVSIEYGTPFYVNDLAAEDKKHVGAYTREIIAEMLAK